MSRFERQKVLPGFGTEGQQKLSNAKVLVIGTGGLGCPVLLYLGAAGVGTIGIADGDGVSESNLNRQILFGQKDIGKPKAETAAKILQEKYHDIDFKVIPYFLTSENALEVLENYDLVLDGSDNFGTRYMINDACILLGIPLVMGAIYQYEGQLSVFNFGKNPVNYRDMYPLPPKENEIPNCSQTGVLGVLPGIIGSLQATEVIKIISGMGEVLTNKMLFYNMKTCIFYEVEISENDKAREEIPKNKEKFRRKDYNISCGIAEIIKWDKALEWSKKLENYKLIDIREPNEEPFFKFSGIEKIPMRNLEKNPEQLKMVEHIILFCKTGKRSKNMAENLKKQFPEKKIFSVAGGILDPASPLKTYIK